MVLRFFISSAIFSCVILLLWYRVGLSLHFCWHQTNQPLFCPQTGVSLSAKQGAAASSSFNRWCLGVQNHTLIPCTLKEKRFSKFVLLCISVSEWLSERQTQRERRERDRERGETERERDREKRQRERERQEREETEERQRERRETERDRERERRERETERERLLSSY